MIMMLEVECKRCGYEWKSRVEEPKECPRCKRRDWDEEKGEKLGTVERVMVGEGGASGVGVCRRCGKEVVVVGGVNVAHEGVVQWQMCPGSMEEAGEVREGAVAASGAAEIIEEVEGGLGGSGGVSSGIDRIQRGVGACPVCGEAAGTAMGLLAAHKTKDGRLCEGSLTRVPCVGFGGRQG